jgi:hypothetical protein
MGLLYDRRARATRRGLRLATRVGLACASLMERDYGSGLALHQVRIAHHGDAGALFSSRAAPPVPSSERSAGVSATPRRSPRARVTAAQASSSAPAS